jgi:hypothetical protein
MTYALKNETTLTQNAPEEASLLIAFANLLERFGKPVDPATLADNMRSRGIADVMFGSVSIIDSTVQVSNFSGPGVPTSNDTIMKFDYISPVTEQVATIFCLVADASAGTIIDIYSGIEKSWSVYGGPGSYASYTNTSVQASEPAPEAVVATPEPIPVNDTTIAPEPPTEPETVSVLETHEVTPVSESAVSDTTPATSISNDTPPTGHEAVPIPVKVVLNSWQASYKPGLGVLDTTAIKNVTITDLAGEQPDVELYAGEAAMIVGRFEKDGQAYYRTDKSAEAGYWYGIPAGSIIQTSKLQEDEDINEIFLRDSTTPKEKVIKAAATVEGKTKRLFSFGKRT